MITLFQVISSGCVGWGCWHFNFAKNVGNRSQAAIRTARPVQIDAWIFWMHVGNHILIVLLFFNEANIPIKVIHCCNISSNWVRFAGRKSREVSWPSEKWIAAQTLVANGVDIGWYELMERPCSRDSGPMLVSGIHCWSSLLQVLCSDAVKHYVLDVFDTELVKLLERVDEILLTAQTFQTC